jgi:GT2 family glycosyltransferase
MQQTIFLFISRGVVDNGSADESVARLKSAYPDILVIENGENLGFARGCNGGIRYALEQGADYVWLLNNDTVVHPEALTAMVRVAESDSSIGIVGSVIYRMDDPDQVDAWGGGRVSLITGRARHVVEPRIPHRLNYITGASMLVHRRVWEGVGLLDEAFFMYCDDSDYSLRVAKAGFALAVAEGSKIWHKVSASTGAGSAYQDFLTMKALRILLHKHSRHPRLAIAINLALRTTKRIAFGRLKSLRAVWSACAKVNWDYPS